MKIQQALDAERAEERRRIAEAMRAEIIPSKTDPEAMWAVLALRVWADKIERDEL